MIRVCSGNNAATVGTNYLLGVATRFAKVSIGLSEATVATGSKQIEHIREIVNLGNPVEGEHDYGLKLKAIPL
jgi:hypothetical protein